MARVTDLEHSTTRVFSSPTAVFSPRLPVKRDWTHPPATQAHMFGQEASEFSHSVHSTALPPDRHFFDGIMERRSSFGNILALYGNWTNNLHTLLWRPSERLVSSLGWSVPNSITYAFHQSPDSALGSQRPLCGDVLLSFCPYTLDSADVFMSACYLQPQNLTPIFKPLS